MVLNNYIKFSLIIALMLSIQLISAKEKVSYEISSDSSTQDFSKQILIYKGNAIFATESTTVKGDEIRAYNTAQETKEVIVTGNSAQLSQYSESLHQQIQLSAGSIHYQLEDKIVTAKNDIVIFQTTNNSSNLTNQEPISVGKSESYFRAQGQEMKLLPSPQNRLIMSGNPVKITINHPNQEPLVIRANSLTYDQIEQQFQLLGDVVVSTGRENIKTAKVLYNGKTRVLQLPETQGQRVEMTQTIKGSND